jgi:hypothetical protein
MACSPSGEPRTRASCRYVQQSFSEKSNYRTGRTRVGIVSCMYITYRKDWCRRCILHVHHFSSVYFAIRSSLLLTMFTTTHCALHSILSGDAECRPHRRRDLETLLRRQTWQKGKLTILGRPRTVVLHSPCWSSDQERSCSTPHADRAGMILEAALCKYTNITPAPRSLQHGGILEMTPSPVPKAQFELSPTVAMHGKLLSCTSQYSSTQHRGRAQESALNDLMLVQVTISVPLSIHSSMGVHIAPQVHDHFFVALATPQCSGCPCRGCKRRMDHTTGHKQCVMRFRQEIFSIWGQNLQPFVRVRT